MGIRRMKPIPKTQKEISKDLQPEPYDTQQGNPNDAQYDPSNRGNQLSFKGDTVKPFNVGIQDIDESIMYYFENVIQPTVFQNGTTIPIPIIYGSPERMKSIQKDGYYRDKAGKIMAPLIMYKRDNIEKNYSIGNKLDANQPHNYAVAQKHYSKQNEYDNFLEIGRFYPHPRVTQKPLKSSHFARSPRFSGKLDQIFLFHQLHHQISPLGPDTLHPQDRHQ